MNVDRLRNLLEAAVKLELATIPPYLCALYSTHPGSNLETTLVIRSVVVEEMLHMILAANVLNAIGGRPRVSGREHAPHYPHELPDGVVLDLLPFSAAAVESFLQVENPEYKADPQAVAPGSDRRGSVHHSHVLTVAEGPTTIGAFYAGIVAGLKQVAADIGEQALFCGDPARQVGGDYYYAAGGAPVIVTDLDSACRALEEVVEQGEGDMSEAFDADDDLAHYYRFEQLKYGRSYQPGDGVGLPTGPPVEVDFTAVYPMLPNPRLDEYADPDLRAAAERCNRQWSELLTQIDEAFNGFPARLIPAVHTMFRLRDAMLVLLGNPMPGHQGYHAGPTFEWTDVATSAPVAPRRIPSTAKAAL
ncbi:MAG TPA: ferritin-like protein [Propionibacteriaceae bacterium]|nr:ferritin-like protein [Propionibacteriaceae bacterium]